MEIHEVPYVEKRTISLIIIGFVGKEADALRSALEAYNYRVDTHWIGSKKELVKILQGHIPTFQTVVLIGHGSDDGILIDGEPTLNAEEIRLYCKIKDKVVVNMGCSTGKEHIAKSFINNGVKTYIAPIDDIEGSSSLLFTLHLFYYLSNGMELNEAVKKSCQFDDECNLFKMYLNE